MYFLFAITKQMTLQIVANIYLNILRKKFN